MPSISEQSFLASIDCRFPYADERKGRELIRQGKSISAFAAW